MSTDCQIFVLSNVLMKVSGHCTDHMKSGEQHTAYSQ